MTKHIKPIAIAAVFLVGCAVGGASARFVVPPANAQQQATLTKWEYTCFSSDPNRLKEMTVKANAAGLEGWEMVGRGGGAYAYDLWCFKRPLVR